MVTLLIQLSLLGIVVSSDLSTDEVPETTNLEWKSTGMTVTDIYQLHPWSYMINKLTTAQPWSCDSSDPCQCESAETICDSMIQCQWINEECVSNVDTALSHHSDYAQHENFSAKVKCPNFPVCSD